MQNSEIISVAVGGGLVLFGGVLLRIHFAAWKQHQADPGSDENDLRYYRSQLRRRVQTSGLIILLGLMIPTGDNIFIPWERFPKSFTLYWIAVLLLAAWIITLAMSDWVSSRFHARAARSSLIELMRKQQELEEEVMRLRREHSANSGEN